MQALRVLFVDDDPDTVEAMIALLGMLGWGDRGEVCSEAARTLAMSWHPNVLLTDVAMPKLDGRQLAIELRKAFPDLTAIALSGYPEGQGSQGHEPFHHYFIKPLNVDQLREVLGAR